jgi:hypothetical protein
VEAASTKAAVTVGDNAPLTSGKKTESISEIKEHRFEWSINCLVKKV